MARWVHLGWVAPLANSDEIEYALEVHAYYYNCPAVFANEWNDYGNIYYTCGTCGTYL